MAITVKQQLNSMRSKKLALSTEGKGGAPMLSSDLCRFRRSSFDRQAWPSCCNRWTRACCSLSSDSSRSVSGINDVRCSKTERMACCLCIFDQHRSAQLGSWHVTTK